MIKRILIIQVTLLSSSPSSRSILLLRHIFEIYIFWSLNYKSNMSLKFFWNKKNQSPYSKIIIVLTIFLIRSSLIFWSRTFDEFFKTAETSKGDTNKDPIEDHKSVDDKIAEEVEVIHKDVKEDASEIEMEIQKEAIREAFEILFIILYIN